ncbi:MAG TPA: OmpA family protein, partial [Segetibacter sp.]
QTEVSSDAKESFASRLSKAVNKTPAAKPANANNTRTPESNSLAPVVKQQKHEKLIEDIKDKSTKEGEHIVLRHINFYGGRHAFLPQAYPALDDLLETMQKVPTLQIEIQGHICCQEGEGDQTDFDSGEPVLSVTRAKAVYDFLIENGIDKKRMTYKGLAHKFPIIKVETNEEEATINRRVEIKIVRK